MSANTACNSFARPIALIVGGSSGLGLEIAKKLTASHLVVITGRSDPELSHLQFFPLELSGERSNLSKEIDKFMRSLSSLVFDRPLDLLVYSACFSQQGDFVSFADADISGMANINLVAPALLLGRILKKQDILSEFIAITSTSQWVPRKNEPIYSASKAALGMLAESVSLDDRIQKVLVAGPAGMNTPFWRKGERDMSSMLAPEWVAEQVLRESLGNFSYKFIHILRDPSRTEVMTVRGD